MRGNYFHNWMAREVQVLLISHGFTTYLEHGIPMPDGVTNYVDMLAVHGSFRLLVELETSERYVLVNALKAKILRIPLWIIVANRQLKRRIEAKLQKHLPETTGIKVILLPYVEQELKQLKCIKFPG
jgi:hypothetical protein